MSICFHSGGGEILNGRITTSCAKCIFNFLRKCFLGVPGGVSQLSVQLLIVDFGLGHNLRVVRSSPQWGSMLNVEHA